MKDTKPFAVPERFIQELIAAVAAGADVTAGVQGMWREHVDPKRTILCIVKKPEGHDRDDLMVPPFSILEYCKNFGIVELELVPKAGKPQGPMFLKNPGGKTGKQLSTPRTTQRQESWWHYGVSRHVMSSTEELYQFRVPTDEFLRVAQEAAEKFPDADLLAVEQVVGDLVHFETAHGAHRTIQNADHFGYLKSIAKKHRTDKSSPRETRKELNRLSDGRPSKNARSRRSPAQPRQGLVGVVEVKKERKENDDSSAEESDWSTQDIVRSTSVCSLEVLGSAPSAAEGSAWEASRCRSPPLPPPASALVESDPWHADFNARCSSGGSEVDVDPWSMDLCLTPDLPGSSAPKQ